MAETRPDLEVRNDPVDVVAILSLPAGTYFIQNVGEVTIRLAQRPAAVADVAEVAKAGGHRILPGRDLTFSVTGADPTYVWVERRGKLSYVSITEVP